MCRIAGSYTHISCDARCWHMRCKYKRTSARKFFRNAGKAVLKLGSIWNWVGVNWGAAVPSNGGDKDFTGNRARQRAGTHSVSLIPVKRAGGQHLGTTPWASGAPCRASHQKSLHGSRSHRRAASRGDFDGTLVRRLAFFFHFCEQHGPASSRARSNAHPRLIE